MKLRYNITKRFLPREYDTEDEWGNMIRTPNPNPTVQIMSGQWSRNKRGDMKEIVLREMSALDFRRLTGQIIYGGNVEKRGVNVIPVSEALFHRVRGTQPRRVLPNKSQIQEMREERSEQRVLIRRKSR